jgi:AAA domain
VSDNVHPIVEPDAQQMLRHVQHLFGGELDGCHEGKIELAWTDGRDGRLRHADLFGTDQLEDLVERAARENRIPGQNVYIGQALRKPDIAPCGRCSDDDFFALTAFYADLDDDVIATARISYRHRGCPPTGVVVTGRHPHVRAQMLWRLETPERDPEVCRRQNRALADALGGDPSVVNPGRVMRLGGSVAWPVKPDRIVERTEFPTFDDGRPRVYLPGQLVRAFPPAPPESPDLDTSPDDAARLHIGSEFHGVTVDACLAAVRAGDHWHDNLVRLTGHWIARGWSDAEILAAAEALTLPGYTVDQTRREVARMIAGGRAKWNLPDPSHEVDASHQQPPITPAFVERLDVAMLPRRRWLLGRALLRGNLTLKIAPPGVGKSTLGIEQAVAIVTGRPITDQEVHEQTKVWIYNNEDDADELKRRLAAVLQHWDIPLDEVRGRLALNSGADRPLLVAKVDRAGTVIRMPDVDACIEHIRAHQIGAFIVDPFVETHEVTENSNEQIKAVAVLFREIARAGNCAVVLVHHTAKPPQGSSDGHAGNLNTSRGASALAGVARIVHTLFSMSARDAEQHGVDDEERHLFVRLDDAKANLGLISGRARWFRRVGVTIANGEEVGVLVPEDLQPVADAGADLTRDDFHRTIVAALLAQVPEDGVTVNSAAKLLAWGPHGAFHRYRQTDDRGHQRVSRTLRDAIVAACRACSTIVDGLCSRGFTCDEQASPKRLRRFEHPFTPTTQGLDRPEFEKDQPW